jgi:DNA-binding NarL/FixJ family response regulator
MPIPERKQPTRIRVLLADDSPAVLAGIRRLLVPEFEIVGSVSDGLALVSAAKALKPDVMIVDVMMPGLSGLEAVKRLRKIPRFNATAIILTVFDDPSMVAEARAAGAMGYVVKSAADRDLVNAIHASLEGRFYSSPTRQRTLSTTLRPTKSLTRR